MIFKKLVFIFILILMFSTIVLADTKPVAAKIDFDGNVKEAMINLYVMVNNEDLGEITCKIKNNIGFGSSAFSTNLGNLVYKEFPSVSCNDLWSTGDEIWFEVILDNKIWFSKKEEIKSGTGLQMLSSLNIDNIFLPDKVEEVTTPTSSGGGSDSSKELKPKKDLIDDWKKEEKFNEVINKIKLKIDLIEIDLVDNFIIIKSKLGFLEEYPDEIKIKHIIYSYPGEDVVKVLLSNNVFLKDMEINEEFSIDQLSQGRYKIRSFVYSLDNVIAVSKPIIFNIFKEKSLFPREEIPKSVTLEPNVLEKIPFWMIISLTLVLMVIFLFLSKLIKKDN